MVPSWLAQTSTRSTDVPFVMLVEALSPAKRAPLASYWPMRIRKVSGRDVSAGLGSKMV
jgi:hypothetical protein